MSKHIENMTFAAEKGNVEVTNITVKDGTVSGHTVYVHMSHTAQTFNA